MRPILPVAAAAALLSFAGAANAQGAPDGARQLSWPSKRAAPAPAEQGPVAAPPSAASYSEVSVPAPFMAASSGPRINNRYSARGAAPRRVAFAAMTPSPLPVAPPPAYQPPAPSFPTADYGPPVIPNEVKPARVISAPEPVRAQPAPTRPAPTRLAPMIAETPAPRAAPLPAEPAPSPVVVAAPARPTPAPVIAAAPVRAPVAQPATAQSAPALPAPMQAAAPAVDKPFIRPASPNGPRFYSVHREFGAQPDATLRSKPTGAATERLPSGFFASGETAAEGEDEPQDDAETRAAALRAAEKATKAKGGKR